MTRCQSTDPLVKAKHFWDRVAWMGAADDDCWPWDGSVPHRDGYPVGVTITYRGGQIAGHRAAYILTFGPIPDGLAVDHECHNRDETCPGGRACMHRRCCNPWHLTLRTPVDNAAASRCTNGNRTHCKRGHAFAGRNLRVTAAGKRFCRACACINTANYLRRKANR